MRRHDSGNQRRGGCLRVRGEWIKCLSSIHGNEQGEAGKDWPQAK